MQSTSSSSSSSSSSSDGGSVVVSSAPPLPPAAPPLAPPAAPPLAALPPGGVPAPPPPPGAPSMAAAGPALPPPFTYSPSVPMKPFFWKVIPPRLIAGSVWETVTGEDTKYKTKFDQPELERLFPKTAAKSKLNQGSSQLQQQQAAAAAGGTSQVRTLLPEKRSRAIIIPLNKLKLSPTQLADACWKLDGATLTDDVIELLTNMVPTADEIQLYASFKGEKELLGLEDQCLMTLAAIPNLAARLSCFRFYRSCAQVAEELIRSFGRMKKAMAALRRSAALKAVLCHVLCLGNYLNSNTVKGGAYGFELSTLEKLELTRDATGQGNLLTYLVRLLLTEDKQKSGPSSSSSSSSSVVDQLLQELQPVIKAKCMDWLSIKEQFASFRKNLAQLEQQLDFLKSPTAANKLKQEEKDKDRFVTLFSPWLHKAQTYSKAVQVEHEQVCSELPQLCSYFQEEPNTPPELIVSAVAAFASQLASTKAQIEEQELQLAKREAIEEQKLDARMRAYMGGGTGKSAAATPIRGRADAVSGLNQAAAAAGVAADSIMTNLLTPAKRRMTATDRVAAAATASAQRITANATATATATANATATSNDIVARIRHRKATENTPSTSVRKAGRKFTTASARKFTTGRSSVLEDTDGETVATALAFGDVTNKL